MSRTTVPSGWEETRLSEITFHKSGNSKLIKGKLASEPAEGLFPAFSASGQDVWHSQPEGEGEAIIVSAVGARCGKAFLAAGRWAAIANTHIVKTYGQIDTRYFFLLLNNERFWEKGGTAQPFVKVRKTFERNILLPPVNEQRRIVEKVDALFAHSRKAKASLDRVPALLEKLKKSILAAAFRGDLTKDWREAHPDVEPADQLLERIRTERRRRWEEAELAKMRAKGKEPKNDKWKEKYFEPKGISAGELPKLPPRWVWASWEQLSERVTVGHVGSMKDEYRADGVPFLRSQNVRENSYSADGICYISTAFHERLAKSKLTPGDLLVVRSGSVGVTCVVPEWMSEANCSDLVIIQRPLGVISEYGSIYMNSAAQGQIRAGAVGVALTHFNTKSVASLPVALPPLAEQREITRRAELVLESVGVMRDFHRRQIGQLECLQRVVLSKAFRGELVPQDPNDEPASVLLEHIRAERAAAAPAKKKRGGRRKAKTSAAPDDGGEEPAPASNSSTETEPVSSSPSSPQTLGAEARAAQPELPFSARDFLELTGTEQAQAFSSTLFGAGPLPKADAVRLAAEGLSALGLSHHQRLRTGGKLWTALEGALERAVKLGLCDRPARGQVRAIRPDPKAWTAADWRLVVDAVPPTADLGTWVRTAAEWAQAQCGLEFARLRSGGTIDRALRAAAASREPS